MKEIKEENIDGCAGLIFVLFFAITLIALIIKFEWGLDISWWWITGPFTLLFGSVIIAVAWVEFERALADIAKRDVDKKEKLKKQK